MKIEAPKRKFIAPDLKITSWEDVKPYVEQLHNRSIESEVDFKQWLHDRSELDAVLEEDAAWRYIQMTIDTRDEALSKAYTLFISEIQPELAPWEDKLNQKMMSSPYVESLQNDEAYKIYFRSVQTALDLFHEENVLLESETSELAQQYGAIMAAQMVEYNNQKMTMQRASLLLREQDETVRQTIFDLIGKRRLEDDQKLDELFTQLVQKRHQIALNAGFKNYRDYKFKALGRFDYTPEDCFTFHASVRKHLVPLVKKMHEKQANLLGKSKLKPWDLEVEASGKEPLKPFETGEQLLNGTIEMFDRIDPFFGDCLKTMNQMGHLDLESKEGKAPGGYNYPLYEIGVPFIFMNAVGAHRDLVTMVHEGGHAIHSFLSRDLALTGFKNLPSEVAELASMSMELLSMDQWHTFFQDEDTLKRAKVEQLETILKILPWIATIDEFQHWIYENPAHSIEDRNETWLRISQSYGTGWVDWSGFEDYRTHSWHRQLHLFEVPFYYIEYGIAQLGALAVWKNSKTNFNQAIETYKNALRLGYTKSIPEIYKEAEIRFDFSDQYIQELADFVQKELEKIEE